MSHMIESRIRREGNLDVTRRSALSLAALILTVFGLALGMAAAQNDAGNSNATPASEASVPDAKAPAPSAAPVAPIAATPSPDASASDARPAKVDSALVEKLENSELGLSLSGNARSGAARAALSGKSASLGMPTHENVDFTQADLTFTARPSAMTAGHLIVRMHQDWNNYYHEGPDPLLARWYDYGGKIDDGKIQFALGDFRDQLSPLTLYAPEPELLYEPEIFKERRQLAMDEFFVGDNRLPLQGVHAVYDQDFGSDFGLKAGVTGARLRTATAAATWLFWTDDVEKFLGTGYVTLRAWDALELGGTYLQIVDNVPTSRSANNAYVKLASPSVYEDVHVADGSLALDGARFLKSSPFQLRAQMELAQSAYQKAHDVGDTAAKTLTLSKDPELDGQALRADLRGGYAPGRDANFSLHFNLAYLKNDADYVNDVAQTPTFIGRRIMNSRNTVGGPTGGYSSLDALYDHVYTVDPVTYMNTSEFWFSDSKVYNGTNNWYRAADFKNSWSNAVMTKTERDALTAGGQLDPQLQLLYPFGPATPNRQGIDVNATAGALGDKLEATLWFASLQEIKGLAIDSAASLPAASFGRIGGGLKVQVGEMLGLSHRITLQGSYVADSRKQPGYALADTAYAGSDFKTAMTGVGLYAGIWKGLALQGGFQSIASNPILGYTATGKTKTATAGDLNQQQWSAGVEVKVTHGVYATADYGQLSVKENHSGAAFTQDIMDANLIVGF